MKDITLCPGQECPFKQDCKRYTTKGGEYQSYFVEAPYDKEANECKFFWGKPQESILNQLKSIVEGKG